MSSDLVPQKPTITQFGRKDSRLATSLDLSSRENKLKMMECLNDCTARLTEEVNEIIVVTNYFIHDVQKIDDKTGEVKNLERLVLIDADGNTHETTGATLIESLKIVCFAEGSPPWPNGVKLKVRSKKKNTKDIYFFEIQ